MPMGVTGENLAEKYNITRQDCDEFALLSQKRWAEGNGKLISFIYQRPDKCETKIIKNIC